VANERGKRGLTIAYTDPQGTVMEFVPALQVSSESRSDEVRASALGLWLITAHSGLLLGLSSSRSDGNMARQCKPRHPSSQVHAAYCWERQVSRSDRWEARAWESVRGPHAQFTAAAHSFANEVACSQVVIQPQVIQARDCILSGLGLSQATCGKQVRPAAPRVPFRASGGRWRCAHVHIGRCLCLHVRERQGAHASVLSRGIGLSSRTM
jgi:hypothetical protein